MNGVQLRLERNISVDRPMDALILQQFGKLN
jgi:hypothetical protein